MFTIHGPENEKDRGLFQCAHGLSLSYVDDQSDGKTLQAHLVQQRHHHRLLIFASLFLYIVPVPFGAHHKGDTQKVSSFFSSNMENEYE